MMRTSWLDGSWVISPSRGRGDLRRDPGGQRLGVGLWGAAVVIHSLLWRYFSILPTGLIGPLHAG